ncbi:TetR/AcrR family transcriptional regulator [Desulfatibacillum aliphaticivorans]|uniref:Transcriptional regulator, TetR family n=1 Tax=Desulfatibacillum aliphaticivorans TaxID=218208 RepID=B8FGH4_DESAL|nr:TetR/AcrR family transcriptional regulator [Desulfatibacillum aliphaticivorans]ACL04883.1 transcriptional regulator, TetR family [Desulfatibacillum aliphaticivorans]
MKGRILRDARKIFGEYGFHGTTTRMIAQKVGIDISTLYYHWGEKGDLYEAVVQDIFEDLRSKLVEIEHIIHGKPLADRLTIALDIMTDYLFENPEISNLTLYRYFTKTRHESVLEVKVPETMGNIAYSMGLVNDKKALPVDAKMKMLAMMNSIHNFISGEGFFKVLLDVNHEDYVRVVKDTLGFVLVPAFTQATKAQDPSE